MPPETAWNSRLDELRRRLGEDISIEYHFVTMFGCTDERIRGGWSDRGGFAGFGQHTQEVGEGFPEAEICSEAWTTCRPHSSAMSHLFLKAVQRLEASSVISARARDEYSSRSLFEECLWRTRCAFFRHGQDIGQLQTLLGVAESLDLPVDRVSELIQNGEAMAELFRDVALKDRLHIEGSPTYVLNEGRQKLYGNVGYRTIEANVRELMQDPGDHASWC